MTDLRQKTSLNIKKLVAQPYKHGFRTFVKKEPFPTGLNEKILSLISEMKNEPQFLKHFRLKAYKTWLSLKEPKWANLKFPPIEFSKIQYYSKPVKHPGANLISNNTDPEILKAFDALGIYLASEKMEHKNVAIDAIFDSVSIATTYKEKLAKYGVIFCSISEAIKYYPRIVEKFLGTVVSPGDNFFAALNSSVFTDGSFCFIPKNVKCPLELSTYFRINDENSGQFERTLIVAEKNSSISYLEGCTAPIFDKNQLHAAIVELIAFENANIKYSTVQNWYAGDEKGKGGVYNFVTKRGLCLGRKSKISWAQVETGSSITWKYPSCLLLGESSMGEFYSVALTKNYQQADTGTKMVHIGRNTKSIIISKGISCDFSKNSYRGLVKLGSNAKHARNFSQCDSFLLGSNSQASTYPYLDAWNSNSVIEHEAKISKMSDDQLFYLTQRGISLEKAISLLINGFCKEVLSKLPLEFSSEAEKLLSLKLEGTIG